MSFFSVLDCTFTYTSAKTLSLITTSGIEKPWSDVRLEFDLQGPGLPGARYFKKISVDGPFIFAITPDQKVWYCDDSQWHQYQTAKDIRYS